MGEPNGSKQFPVLGVCAFLAVGFVALLASGNPPHSASAASGGGAEMVLTLPSHDNCDDPDQPTICTLATGTTFTVSVDLLNSPPVGYILAQVWIQYDSQGLVYKPLLSGLPPPLPPTTTKVIWPDAALDTITKDTITNIFDPVNHVAAGGATTGVFSPPASFYSGSMFEFEFNCTNSPSKSTLELLPAGPPPANTSGALLTLSTGGKLVPKVGDLTIECLGLLEPGDTDGDGCSDRRELGDDQTLGGRRDYQNPWDFYDVAGGGGGPPDQIVDLPNDILGVIQHYAPLGTEPRYDAAFDRGPKVPGEEAWDLTAPDGVIDLAHDILGVIRQFNHSCQ